VPPDGTTIVVGSVPAVCTYPVGRVLSTMSVTVGPAGTSTVYVPVESVVRVRVSPVLVVTTTFTPSIPGSLGSCTPFAFKSSNTTPLTFPKGLGVGAAVGDAVGEAVGDDVGDAVGASVGR